MRDDGRWEGLIEFAPATIGIGRVVRTPVQTTQSSVKQLLYWASGLSRTNLESSLMTALYPPPPRPPQPRAEEQRQSLGPDDAELPPPKPSR